MIRHATGNDHTAICELAANTPGAPHWSDRQYEELLRSSAEPNSGRSVFLSESSSKLLGFIVTSAAGGEGELESVVVTADQRRRGLGRELCDRALNWRLERGIQVAWLEVRSANDAARALYTAMGFEEVGVRQAYYSDPKEDAVVMRALLSGATHL